MSQLGSFIESELKRKGLSQSGLADYTGASRGNVTEWIKHGAKPRPDKLVKIAEYLGLSIEALTSGGENHKEQGPGSYIEKRRTSKIEQPTSAMPVFESAPATLSSIESYRDSPHDGPDFWLSIPQYRKCNYACRAKGDSMHPAIRNHALVGGRQIEDPSLIMFGDIYIIHTRNGIETIKYIHPHPDRPEMVLLVPYNKEAKVTPIERADIIRLYAAEFVINPL